MMNNYIYKSATELAKLIRNRQATSTEIVKEHLAQIKQHNAELNAVVIILEEEALKTASEEIRSEIGKFIDQLDKK